MITRTASKDDFEDIVRLYHQLNPDDPAITDGADRSMYDIIIASNWLHIFVLEVEEIIVATAYLNVIPNITRKVSPYAIIENVVTEETQRGKGFGKYLIQEVLNFAWKNGCYKAILQTGSKKESTHEFYKACGFIKGERFAFVAYPPKE